MRRSKFAPMEQFSRSFPLVILLSLWVVVFVSLVQIRRTLVPLEKLQEGTQRIGARQFDGRVEVQSGDEFEELATSFNSMAEQLGRQFHTLKTINEIDQAIFASLDRDGIIDGVLSCMPSLLPSDCFGVCVLDETSPHAVLSSTVRAGTRPTLRRLSPIRRTLRAWATMDSLRVIESRPSVTKLLDHHRASSKHSVVPADDHSGASSA